MKSLEKALITPFQFLSSFGAILTTASLRSTIVIPCLLGLISAGAFIGLFFGYKQELFVWLYGPEHNTISSVLYVLYSIAGPIAAAIAAILIMLIVGAVFIDTLIARAFQLLGVEVLVPKGLTGAIKSLGRGLIDAVRWTLLALLILAISIICSLIPVLWPVPFILTAISLGLLLIDLPLSILGVPFGDRVALGFKHFLELIALGGCFSVLLIIPFGGILFLPIGYHVAVTKIVRWKFESKNS